MVRRSEEGGGPCLVSRKCRARRPRIIARPLAVAPEAPGATRLHAVTNEEIWFHGARGLRHRLCGKGCKPQEGLRPEPDASSTNGINHASNEQAGTRQSRRAVDGIGGNGSGSSRFGRLCHGAVPRLRCGLWRRLCGRQQCIRQQLWRHDLQHYAVRQRLHQRVRQHLQRLQRQLRSERAAAVSVSTADPCAGVFAAAAELFPVSE